LVSINWSELITSDINTSWLNVKETLLSTEKKHSRVIYQRQPKTLPFLTKDTKRTINRKARAWKRYKKKKTQENWLRYAKAWNLVSDSVRKLKSEYEEKLATDIKANPKSFWRHVSAKSPNCHTIPDLKHSRVTYSLLIDKANLLNVQFASHPVQPSLQHHHILYLSQCLAC
jgi:phage terminase large subunit GpA-like protein